MVYVGSKNKIAAHILPIMRGKMRLGDTWVEPFVGGANMIDKVTDCHRIGADNNGPLIAMWKALCNGWTPPTCLTIRQYEHLRGMRRLQKPLVGWAGTVASHKGKWFGGFAHYTVSADKARNYYAEHRLNVMRQVKLLCGVEWIHSPFHRLEIPRKSVVYCDPPYEDSTGYHSGFDHTAFWEWDGTVKAREVFVSEYRAPAGWKEVWSRPVHGTHLSNPKDRTRTYAEEKLFRRK